MDNTELYIESLNKIIKLQDDLIIILKAEIQQSKLSVTLGSGFPGGIHTPQPVQSPIPPMYTYQPSPFINPNYTTGSAISLSDLNTTHITNLDNGNITLTDTEIG